MDWVHPSFQGWSDPMYAFDCGDGVVPVSCLVGGVNKDSEK
jgi:hypothetical protein